MQRELSQEVHNALTELGNIGAGNATTSLSILLSSQITITPPHVKMYEFNELENFFGGAEATTVAVLSNIEGDIGAMFLFLMKEEDAEQLLKEFVRDDIILNSDYGMDVVREIGNIMIGSYVASLETLSGLKIRYSVPQIITDMAGAILSLPCTVFGQVEDKVLLIDSGFASGEKRIKGFIMMISERNSYDVLLEKLGIERAYE